MDHRIKHSHTLNVNPSLGQAFRLSECSCIRYLPHFQLSAGYRKILNHPQKDCVFDAICFLDSEKYELYSVVILDDHVHMVINPMDNLSKIMHRIKSFTTHEINIALNKRGKVWQDENYDRVIRNDEDFLEMLNYIANNPIKSNLATSPKDYKWLYIIRMVRQ